MPDRPRAEDVRLIEACLKRHPGELDAAFEELYERHARVVLAFLRTLHRGDEHGAHDALQETFFRFFASLNNFDTRRSLRPWLLAIARNVSFDAIKKKSRGPHFSSEIEQAAGVDEPAFEEASRKERRSLMRRALGLLDLDERAVFHLKHDAGLTYEQAAAVLGCSVRTAKYRMKSALERLGRELERLGMEVSS